MSGQQNPSPGRCRRPIVGRARGRDYERAVEWLFANDPQQGFPMRAGALSVSFELLLCLPERYAELAVKFIPQFLEEQGRRGQLPQWIETSAGRGQSKAQIVSVSASFQIPREALAPVAQPGACCRSASLAETGGGHRPEVCDADRR
jgi:hypothetical protein